MEEVWLKASQVEICPCSPTPWLQDRDHFFLSFKTLMQPWQQLLLTVEDLHGFVTRNIKCKEVFVKTTCCRMKVVLEAP